MTLNSLTLAAMAAATILSVPYVAKAQFQEDFDSYATGVPPVPPWTEYYAGPAGSPVYTRAEAAALGVMVGVTDAVAISGRSVHFSDASSSVSSRLSRGVPSLSSGVVEYYMRSGDASDEGVFVGLRGDSDIGYTVAFGNASGGGMAGYIGVVDFWNGGWPKPDLLPYTEDTWYSVRREFDCATRTGNVYVEEVGNPTNSASHSFSSDAPNTYIDEVRLFTSGSQGADCYIDELAVVPEPGTLALLVVGGLTLLRRRAASLGQRKKGAGR